MINKVIITGRLVADIELRQTNDGTPYTFFTVAVTRATNRERTDFISAVAWRQTADFMNKYMRKGSLIAVEGRLETYTTDVNGQNQTRMNVNTNQVFFLESKAEADRRSNSSGSTNFSSNSSSQSQNLSFEGDIKLDNSTLNNNQSQQEKKEVSEEINFDDIQF